MPEEWEAQIIELETEYDAMIDSGDLDKEKLGDLLDRLEDLLVKRENHYTMRLVK